MVQANEQVKTMQSVIFGECLFQGHSTSKLRKKSLRVLKHVNYFTALETIGKHQG